MQAVLTSRTISTALQLIRRLDTGDVIGVEELTRFDGQPIQSPEARFVEAASVECGPELEFLAMEMALDAAACLPSHLSGFPSVTSQTHAAELRRLICL
ncbi:EAL domain-containing protein (putative c-di-GMP-specific phosphodiesterase class I) [Arthrobacter sp. SLBN-112]|nr:EAL domain-containing protein (putative c-di-GMP-specific phosphodiesterase class I) [Arthrobacter sp. SLBN-112]